MWQSSWIHISTFINLLGSLSRIAVWYQLKMTLVPTCSSIYTVFSTTYWRILLENKDEAKQPQLHCHWKVNSKTSFAFLTCCWRSCYHKMKFANTDESRKTICKKRSCSIWLCNCLHYAKGFRLNLGKPKIKKLRPSKFYPYKTKKQIFGEKLIL